MFKISYNEKVRRAWSCETSPDILDELHNHKSNTIRLGVACNKKSRPKTLEKMPIDACMEVNIYIAKNININYQTTLNLLDCSGFDFNKMRSSYYDINANLLKIISQPSVSFSDDQRKDILLKICFNYNKNVNWPLRGAYFLLNSDLLNREIYDVIKHRLFCHGTKYYYEDNAERIISEGCINETKKMLIHSPFVNSNDIEKIYNRYKDVLDILRHIAANKNTPIDILKFLMKSKDGYIRNTASRCLLKNKGLTNFN